MPDEPAKIIFGEAGISAIEQSAEGRKFFRRKRRQLPPKSRCENCGAELKGYWCSQCGQAAVDYHRSFRYVIWDVLDTFLNWDSKFFATIGLLIAKPWRLTNDFVAGKRVRYFHPLRLYLLASILFFFVVNHWAKGIHFNQERMSEESKAAARAKIEGALQKKELPPEARAQLEEALKAMSATPTPGQKSGESPAKEQASPNPDENDFGPLLQVDGKEPSTSFGKRLEARLKEKIGEHGSKAGLFVATLFNNLPYMMLCCVPLFALILKILYVRRRIFYIEHLVYALHIHSFAYVGITLIVYATIGLGYLNSGALLGWIVAIFWIAFATEILLSIRRVYRQGWFISVLKFLFGGAVYLAVLVFALLVTLFVTVALPG